MKIYKTLTRIFIGPQGLDNLVDFYEKLFVEKCELRFQYSEKNLELAMVGSVLLIAGSAEDLEPFTETKMTYLVDSVSQFLDLFTEQGVTILEPPKSVPTGKNMRVKHPDGLVCEYVEHRLND